MQSECWPNGSDSNRGNFIYGDGLALNSSNPRGSGYFFFVLKS